MNGKLNCMICRDSDMYASIEFLYTPLTFYLKSNARAVGQKVHANVSSVAADSDFLRFLSVPACAVLGDHESFHL